MSAAQTFFQRLLPGLVVARFDDFLATRGSVAFDVRDPEGGQWTFHFADPEPIREGFDDAADLKLAFDADAFEAFVAGTLDAAEAVGRGAVSAEGDFELLSALGVLMLPLQRDNLGWDAG
ncbi:MAG: SCP2 sterol-binding domain-containing protein [Myxococcaceae bacterium]|nr:SCP2 sterol-binding domain-containing protein [Myxococcaceae bacterium]